MFNKLLQKTNKSVFPFEWIDFERLRNSQSFRLEIYLNEDVEDYQIGLEELFVTLFSQHKKSLNIYYDNWGDFAYEDLDPDDLASFANEGTPFVPFGYTEVLEDSKIEKTYVGSCECLDWDSFIKLEIKYVVKWRAMYGHYFFSPDCEFFFYFHHTGSIGFYYKEENSQVREILSKAKAQYRLSYK